jgi:hypothetical protein
MRMLSHRLGLDLVFALFLVNGLLICAAIAAALVTWGARGEGTGMGVFALATSAIAPSLLAWVVSGIRAFMKPAVPDVRLGAVLATAHLLLWALLLALGASGAVASPSGWLLGAPVVATAAYGLAVTWLAVRWFLVRRR